MKMGEAKNFFDKYDMLECAMQDNILSVKKLKDLEFNYDNVGRKISL